MRECDGEGGRVGDVESWRESGRRGGEGVIGEGRGGDGMRVCKRGVGICWRGEG